MAVSTTRHRKYWAFCFLPRDYNFDKALKKSLIDDWYCERSTVNKGDRVLIWTAADEQGRRGIVSLGEIVEGSQFRSVYPRYRNTNESTARENRTLIRYVVPRRCPKWVKDDPNDPLANLNVARRYGGTVTRVSSAQWERVLKLVGGWPKVVETRAAVEAALIASAPDPERRGFGGTVQERQAIERHAMRVAENYFRKRGYMVDPSVAKSRPFDLRCSKGSRELHVEVKGTRSAGAEVPMTAGEVEHTRTYGGPMALFVLRSIRLTQSKSGRCHASGGTPHVVMDWTVANRDLQPIGYWYRVPTATR